MKSYKTIRSESVFQGKVFDVRVDHILTPSGSEARIDVVAHRGSVAMLPIDGEGRILLVRQYRHPIGDTLLEIPAGTLEDGEEVEACAVRECQEEIGFSPGELIPLGRIFLTPGYSSEQIHLYVARDLQPGKFRADPDEDLHREALSPRQVLELLESGEIQDAKTLIALAKAEPYWRSRLEV
jgi:ADP-ribose pyrophosphatase